MRYRGVMGASVVIRLFIAALVGVSAACEAPGEDPVIMVSEDDPEMRLAISRARESLPHFWAVMETRPQGETDFAVKVRIEDFNGVEHFWVTDLRRDGDRIYGLIGNDPQIVRSVKYGDEIEVRDSDIADWLYMRGDKMVGNFTVRPLFRGMPEAEAQRLKSMLADP